MDNVTIRHCGRGVSGESGFIVRTHYTNVAKSLFDENSIGLYLLGTSMNASDLRFKNNTIAIRVSSGDLYLTNSSVTGSLEKDMVLSFSTATLLDTEITYMLTDVKDEGSILTVMWYLHVTVVWNDGQPVTGATVLVEDKSGAITSKTIDDQGYARWMIVKEYQKKGPQDSGYFAYSPLRINVTEKGLSVERSEYVSATTTINIVMVDESPPMIQITNPEDGTVWYNSEILVLGTAVDTGSTTVSIEVSVDGVAWLPANGTSFWSINLTVEGGVHSILARGTDARGNVRTVSISIEIDLTSPMIEVTSPSDGYVTNLSTVMVTGRVHVGSDLLIDGVVVTLSKNGTFEHVVDLIEGPNTINLKALASNGLETMEVSLTVFRDTVPPEIEIRYPIPGTIVNDSLVTVTVASNEDVTFEIDGNLVDTFGGEADYQMEIFEGRNVIYVRARDLAGNTNETYFEIYLDVTKPDLVIEKPINPAFSTTKEKQVIKGRTEPGANLTINDKVITVGPDGNFTAKVKLRYGENTIVIVSRDQANNTNEMILQVKRNQVQDNMSYVWLIVLAFIVGVVADVAVFMYFKRYYKPRPPGDKDHEEYDEDDDYLDDDYDEEPEEVPQRPPRGRPPGRTPDDGMDTEFEEVEDLGSF
jgi:hypothetical protein